MSKSEEIRESLLSIGELLKQLTEEVNELANCFYEEDEVDTLIDAESLSHVITFEAKMDICACCDKCKMCARLHDSNCPILIKKIEDILKEERVKERK